MQTLRTVHDDGLIGPEVHAVARAARSFTGDFYFYAQQEKGLRFVLGDVSGKGLHAALLMAMIQEEIERVAGCEEDLVSFVRGLHEILLPETGGRKFASVVVGDLSREGRLRLVNAGHCLPALRREEGAVELLPPTGPVIGILDFGDWTVIERQLAPGDVLLLYSDGILEATSPEGEEFGTGRVAEALRTGGAGASDIVGSLLRTVGAHRGGPLPEDDSTVMAIVASHAMLSRCA